MLIKEKSKIKAKIDAALESIDDRTKQILLDLMVKLEHDIVEAEPAAINWLLDHVEPAILAVVNHLIKRLRN